MIDEVYTHLTQKDKAKKVSEAFDKAFNPVEELPSPSIIPDEIVQLINEGVAAAMKDAKEDFKKELLQDIANKREMYSSLSSYVNGIVLARGNQKK